MESEEFEKIIKAVHALGANHPLSHQAMAVLSDPDVQIEDLPRLLRSLCKPSLFQRKERAVASWLLKHADWSADQRVAISEILSKSVDKVMQSGRGQRVLLRCFGRGMLVSSLVLFGCMVVVLRSSPGVGLGIGGWMGLLIPLVVLAAFVTLYATCFSAPLSFWLTHRKLKQLVPAVEALGGMKQTAALATIATAATHSPLREAAASALSRVVAELQPSDYGALPVQTVPALNQALGTTAPDTVLVLLNALSFVGDGRAIKMVSYLSRHAFRPDVRTAATNLLPLLYHREQENRTSSMLLRASDAPSDSRETLLRAARDQSPADPAQLLRMAPTHAVEEQTHGRIEQMT